MTPNGTALEAVLPVPEDQLAGPLEQPVTHALVVARHGGRALLVFNRWRRHWELPGGVIDPGEIVRLAWGRRCRGAAGRARRARRPGRCSAPTGEL